MARILTIFSGSMGHNKGLARFIETNKISQHFIFASIDQKAGKTISDFYWIASQPAYMNNEFLMNKPLLEKLQLKIDNVLFIRRKMGLAQLIELTKPDVMLLDNFNFTDALIVRDLEQFPTLKILLYQTRLSTALVSSSKYGGIYNGTFEMLGVKRIIKRQKRKRSLEKVMMPGFSDEYRIQKMIRKFNFQNVKLENYRCGPPVYLFSLS